MLLMYVPNWRAEFPAGVHLTIGKQGDKVIGGSAAISGAAANVGHCLSRQDEVEEVILEHHVWIAFACFDIAFEKFRKFYRVL